MIFREIRLKNFRQYYGDNILKFSAPTDEERNISLIVAENGVGKSTLLQAFRYCFYGSMPNLLKLPKPNELLSDFAVKNAAEMERIDLLVEVHFTHSLKDYIAVRKEVFQKNKGKMVVIEKSFNLLEATKSDGFQKINELEAISRMWIMLPPEISQLFMFDGEHAEQKIENLNTKEFIKQSIIGLFNIKRTDTLIEILSTNRSNVINYIEKRYPDLSVEAKNKLENINNLKRFIKVLEFEIDDIENQIIRLRKEKESLINYQESFDILAKQVKRRSENERLRNDKLVEITEISKSIINDTKLALKHKILNEIRNRYREYISVNSGDPRHYQLLHIDTLKDILGKGICLCGRTVDQHSVEEEHILELFQNALPQDYSHYFTKIDQEFLKAEGYHDIYKKIQTLKEKILFEKYNLNNIESEINSLNLEISSIERQVGTTTQSDYSRVEEAIENLIKEKAQKELIKSNKESEIRKLEIDNRSLLKGNELREKFSTIIEDINKAVSILQKQKKDIDDIARKTLVEKFNTNFNQISNSEYIITIDENYLLKITNKNTESDETEVLSTGQTVAITLTFLKSLIDTAKEITEAENLRQEHGVLIDAAMSNIDEHYTYQISRNYFSNFDQLILMSMKKSLRDELYDGIRNKISVAYKFTKDGLNRIKIENIELDDLDDYIHKNVGES